MTISQRTISNPVSLSGTGLHTGIIATITFVPAKENTGVIFKRTDLADSPELEANAQLVVDTRLGTVLSNGKAVVQTVEHVLAAVFALGIDNLIIEINTSEPPIMDGSAIAFVQALKSVGIVNQNAPKKQFLLTEKIIYEEKDRDVYLSVEPHPYLEIYVEVDYNSEVLPPQSASLTSLGDFEKEIAPCRTFCFLKDVLYMHSVGLIRGGSPDNAVVIVDKPLTETEKQQLSRLFPLPENEISSGFLGTELLFDNEPARHKLLDIIGDLSLVGFPLSGKIIARKPGHKANTELAKLIQQKMTELVFSSR
ncbi:MAG: UDP-3-O-acyl-N-acetylglucosamine deacetylase [Bacteroidia bacterium]|nr:UDP-3-O-acyl-N-acetylglucosamine deacetylase [Bacteroidia bacterium]